MGMTAEDRAKLYAAEEKIEQHVEGAKKGERHQIAIGKQLKLIRDKELYKASAKTFAEYCQTRWEWTDRHARRLISFATGPMGPKNERQARALAKAPKELQKDVMAAASAGGKATAEKVEDIVDQILNEKDPDEQRKLIEKEHEKAEKAAAEPHVFGMQDENALQRRLVRNLKGDLKLCGRIGPPADAVSELIEKAIPLAENMSIAA